MQDRTRSSLAAARFGLAPMSAPIRGLTIVLWCLPLALAAAGRGPGPPLLTTVAALLVALYGAVWLWWRPTAFEVSPGELRIVFPARRRRVPLADLERCRVISARTFRDEHGMAIRVGVGGMWGGFGRLWTRRRGWVDFYVSRTDGLVLVERRGAAPLLLTPAAPERFAALVGESGGRRPSPSVR